jgi:DNA-binding NtrC family response regulator
MVMTTKLDQETDRAVADARPNHISADGFSTTEFARPLRIFRAEAEAHAISRALDCVGWNRRRAAKLLCISYRGLLYKIRQYNITAAGRGEPSQCSMVEK